MFASVVLTKRQTGARVKSVYTRKNISGPRALKVTNPTSEKRRNLKYIGDKLFLQQSFVYRYRDYSDTLTLTADPVINDLKVAFFKSEPHNISHNKFWGVSNAYRLFIYSSALKIGRCYF